jgi:myo-inositol catabolism protein IolS
LDSVIIPGTDIKVSRLSLGTWAFGGDPFWGDQDDKVSADVVAASIDLGINFIDTAAGYAEGRSEEVVGKAIAGRRSEVVLATKVYGTLSREGVVNACEESLSRLQTDFVDVFYLHWPNPEFALDDSLEGLNDLITAGKIRTAAVCNFGPKYLGQLADAKRAGIVSLHQLPFSLLWRSIESEILPRSNDLGLMVVAYSALAQGLLTGRYSVPSDIPQYLKTTRFYGGAAHGEPGCEAELFDALRDLRALAEKEGVSMADLAVQWVLAQPGLGVALTGARTVEEITQNAKSLDKKVSDETLAQASKVTDLVKQKLGPNPDMWMPANQSRFA